MVIREQEVKVIYSATSEELKGQLKDLIKVGNRIVSVVPTSEFVSFDLGVPRASYVIVYEKPYDH
jgi:hypothetical protein